MPPSRLSTMLPNIPRGWWKIFNLAALIVMTNFTSYSFGSHSNFFSQYVNGEQQSDSTAYVSTKNTEPYNRTISVVSDGGTPMLRGGEIVTTTSDGAPTNKTIQKQKFTSPSPHLWTHIPIIQPHTNHKKVLVTGSAGFIGSHVAYALLDRGDTVIIVDEMNDYYDVSIKESNIDLLQEKANEMALKVNKTGSDLLSVYKVDINDVTAMQQIYKSHKPNFVCHLAARAGVRPSIQDPLLYVKANVQGTTSILEYSKQYNITNTVVASSSSVYGESESTYFSEAEQVNEPVSPYAATKRSGELLSYTYHKLYNMNITNLRFFTVYGPRGRQDMAPAKFINRISKGLEIQKFGDGSTSRDYTYVDDIVDGVLRAIDRPYSYQIFNLGKGSGTTLNEFISLVEKHVGKQANIKLMPAQPGDVPFTNADVSKAYRLLGYKSKYTIDEGIRRTVEWYKVQQEKNKKKAYIRTDLPPNLKLLGSNGK